MNLVPSANYPLTFYLILSDIMIVKLDSIINFKIKGDRYELETFVHNSCRINFGRM